MIDNLHLRLFDADYRIITPTTWNTQNVLDSFWRFYMNSRDGAALELEHGIYRLAAQRIYFVPAGVRFNCRNTSSVEHFYVHFDVVGLPNLAHRTLFAGPVQTPPNLHLETATRIIAHSVQAKASIDLVLQCQLKALIYETLACYLHSIPPEQMEHYGRLAAAHEPVLPALQYIEENLHTRITNHHLAHLCHLSEDYFIRRFGECMGQSPLQYILERRVTAAAQRLLFTDHNIEQIAATTGFGNRFYFSRVFARVIGMSPAAYRKTSRV